MHFCFIVRCGLPMRMMKSCNQEVPTYIYAYRIRNISSTHVHIDHELNCFHEIDIQPGKSLLEI